MEKRMKRFGALVLLMAAALSSGPAVFALQRFENESIQVVAKLPPQYLGWVVVEGSTFPQTVPYYYKVSAEVTGIGETQASEVTTAYAKYSPLSSTNSIRLMWASVNGATKYYLYKSLDNVSFYLLTSPTILTYVDEGAALGEAYVGPTLKGGSLTAAQDITAARNISARDFSATFGIHVATITVSASAGIHGLNVSTNVDVGGAMNLADNLNVSSNCAVEQSVTAGVDIIATRNLGGRDVSVTYGVSAASAAITNKVTAKDFSAAFGVAAATGAFTGAFDANGQVTIGADNTSSTFPAAGSPVIYGTLTAGEDLAATRNLTGRDVNVTFGVNAATGAFTNTGAGSLDIGGGLNAGTGNVGIIDATGKIPAINSSYFTATAISGALVDFSTITSILNAHEAFRSTGSAYIGAWNAFASTGPSNVGALEAFRSTATSRIDLAVAGISTAASTALANTFTANQTVTSSMTITGGGGIGVTYGVSAASAAITGTTGISVSTASTSEYSLTFKGAMVDLSTKNVTVGELWYQVSDNKLYISTFAVTGENIEGCASLGCYKALW